MWTRDRRGALCGLCGAIAIWVGPSCTDKADNPFDSPAGTAGTSEGPAPGDGGVGESGSNDTAMFFDVGGGAGDGGGPGTASCDDLSDSNLGCEFWAVDLPNVSVAPDLAVTPENQPFAVVVANAAAGVEAEVSVFRRDDPTPVVTAIVAVDGLHTFELPAQNVAPAKTSADGEAYRLHSDVPITAYQFQPHDNTNPVYSNDATILFPTHVLTGNYTAVTGDATLTVWDGFNVSADNSGGFVSVVATEDATSVTLYPTKPLHPGEFSGVVLDRGQVLTAVAIGDREAGNLSGTRVEADKPVAVFSGSVATSEPTTGEKCCADHVEHQMLPLEAWGTAVAAAPAAAADGSGDHPSLYRLTGAYDGTTLTYEPAPPAGAPTQIDAYQTVAFVTDQPFTVRSTAPEKPLSLTQFLLSNQNFGLLLFPGDPSMLVLSATDQYAEAYVFLVPDGYDANYVTVVRPAGTTTSLDGVEIAQTFWDLGALDGVVFEYAHVRLQPGRHELEASEPVAISVMGYARDVSFGYTGGSGVAEISQPPPPAG